MRISVGMPVLGMEIQNFRRDHIWLKYDIKTWEVENSSHFFLNLSTCLSMVWKRGKNIQNNKMLPVTFG